MARKPAEFHDWPFDLQPAYIYRAVVKHWVDGDTLDVLLDLGLHQYAYETIRVHRINTPEIYGQKEPGELERGQAALAYAMEIAPIGTPVILYTQKDKQTFGRYVADVLLLNNVDYATEMVRAGHAEWSTP